MSLCGLCGGSAHVQDGYVWTRCVCYDIAERNRRCAEAGIPPVYWDMQMTDLLASTTPLLTAKIALVEMVNRIKQNGLTGRYCLVGPSKSVRTIGFLLLRAALYRADGFSTRTDEIGSSYMNDKERVTYRRARDTKALLLLAGVEYPNKLDHHVVATLLKDRDDPDLGTIVLSSIGPAELVSRYGEDALWKSAVLLPTRDFL